MGALSWLAAAAFAQEPASDYRGYLDQARFFLRKEWYSDAEEQLELAVATQDGLTDPEAWYLLATVRYELLDVEGSREAAAHAHTYARDDVQLDQAATFSAFVHEQLGVLQIEAPYPGLSARLDFEITSLIFDPQLTEFLEKAHDKWKRPTLLPVRIGLPVGTYVLNGQEVEVTAQGPNTIVLATNQLGSKTPTVVKLAQAELGIGVSNWIGSRTGNLLPSFDLQVGVSVPAGPLRVGAVLDWIPVHYETFQGSSTGFLGGSVGARVSWDVPRTVPVMIRPAIGYRFGLVPGFELPCVAAGAEYACGGDQADLLVYATALAHVPFAEITLGVLDQSRTADVGFGVKGVAEYALGTIPAKGTAALEDGSELSYTVESSARPWSALGLRALVHLSVAF